MHVGLNLVYLVPGATGGMEVYARELIPELVRAAPEHRFTAFVGQEAAGTPGPWSDAVESVVIPVRASDRLQYVRGEQQFLPAAARRAGVDLLHSLASTAPGWGRFRRVVTIHDLIYRTVPDAHPGLRSLGMRVLVPLAARRSHRVITESAATGEDIVTYLGVARSRLDVVHGGVGSTRQAAPLPEAEVRSLLGAGQRPILLTVSAKLAHKNLGRLIGALASLPAGDRPLLVLPGYPTAHEAELRARASSLGVQDDVRFLGWVSAAELEGFYAAAAAFVFPTLQEGFGLPILEAMARGVPVACSDIPVLREVAGENVVWFDPRSETAIAAGISRLLGDPALAAELRAAGRSQVRRFSWRAAAAGTLASYRRASRHSAPTPNQSS